MTEEQEFDKVALFIGRYLLIFQYIEDKIDQMLLLGADLERRHVGNSFLAAMGYRQKVDALSGIVHTSKIAQGDETQKEWIKAFGRLVNQWQAEGARRNGIVHSLHVFDFVKIGAPVFRNRMRPHPKGFRIKNANVDEKEADNVVAEIAQLLWDTGLAHVQLVHWYEDLGQPGDRVRPARSLSS